MAAVRAHTVQINVRSRSLCQGLQHRLSRSSDLMFPASLSIPSFFSKARVKIKQLQGKFGKIGLQDDSAKGGAGQQIWVKSTWNLFRVVGSILGRSLAGGEKPRMLRTGWATAGEGTPTSMNVHMQQPRDEALLSQ